MSKKNSVKEPPRKSELNRLQEGNINREMSSEKDHVAMSSSGAELKLLQREGIKNGGINSRPRTKRPNLGFMGQGNAPTPQSSVPSLSKSGATTIPSSSTPSQQNQPR